MHEVLVNRLGGLSLPRKSVVRLTDRPDMTLDVYRGRKTTIQQYNTTIVSPSAFSRRAVVSHWRKYVHEVLVNRLGGLRLPRKSVVRLTDRPDMTLDVYRGRKPTMQQLHSRICLFGHLHSQKPNYRLCANQSLYSTTCTENV